MQVEQRISEDITSKLASLGADITRVSLPKKKADNSDPQLKKMLKEVTV